MAGLGGEARSAVRRGRQRQWQQEVDEVERVVDQKQTPRSDEADAGPRWYFLDQGLEFRMKHGRAGARAAVFIVKQLPCAVY